MNLFQGNAFRPIYYLGCKTSFAPIIKEAIDEVDPTEGRLLDLFAGTGSVGAALGQSREVTAVDIQEYSRVICNTMLKPIALSNEAIERIINRIREVEVGLTNNQALKLLIEYEDSCLKDALAGRPQALVELLESSPLITFFEQCASDASSPLLERMTNVINDLKATNSWDAPNTVVTRLFGGVYFSYRQALQLDAVLRVAASEPTYIQDELKAAALSTASQIVNTVGKQFAQPIRPRNKNGAIKSGLVRVVQRDRYMNVLSIYRDWLYQYSKLQPAVDDSVALRMDYIEAIRKRDLHCSVVYADPPYTRDHYSRFYHVLETMCLRDNPGISKVTKNGATGYSRGVYRENRHQSPFCIRSEAPKAFELLFSAARERGVPLVLSYSPHETGDGTHPRVVSMQQVVAIAKEFYPRVEIQAVEGSAHNKLNRTDLELRQREHAEILLKCFPRK